METYSFWRLCWLVCDHAHCDMCIVHTVQYIIQRKLHNSHIAVTVYLLLPLLKFWPASLRSQSDGPIWSAWLRSGLVMVWTLWPPNSLARLCACHPQTGCSQSCPKPARTQQCAQNCHHLLVAQILDNWAQMGFNPTHSHTWYGLKIWNRHINLKKIHYKNTYVLVKKKQMQKR